MTIEQKNLILTLKREGKSSREIGAAANIHFTSVADFLQKYPEDEVECFKRCLNCSKEIIIYIKRRERIDKVYCCKTCKKEYYKRTGIEKHLKKTCECCGKEFMTYSYRPARFCSKSCAKRSYHERLQKKS